MNDSLNDRLSETEPVTIERSKTSVRIVSDYIKSQVIQKELRTGDKIPTEVELSRLLNVGRGSVREAVKLLEALHVLEIRRGDGTYIANPTDESLFDSLLFKIILENISLSELLDFRLQIEIAVQNLAISNAKQEDIDLLEANYGEFARRIYLSSPSEYPKIQELDVAFHVLIGECTKNSLMKNIYQLSMNIFSPIILQNYRVGQIREDSISTLKAHRELIDSIRDHDLYLGIHAIQLSTSVWKKWLELRVQTQDADSLGD